MVLLVMEVGKTPRNGENRTRTVSVVFDLSYTRPVRGESSLVFVCFT